MRHSLRRRQLSVTRGDKTLISRNQISGENTERGGTGKSTKDSRDLIVSIDERRSAAENVSFFHLSFFFSPPHSVFSAWNSFCGWGSASFQHDAWHNERNLVTLPPSDTYIHKFNLTHNVDVLYMSSEFLHNADGLCVIFSVKATGCIVWLVG